MQAAILFLKLGIGGIMVVFGIHKWYNPRHWFGCIPDWFEAISPLGNAALMRTYGVGDLVFGIFLLSGLYPVAATWIALIWWTVGVPFSFYCKWDVGVRDTVITLAAAALLILI
ncbi:DoxX family membrane protein [Candidatus Parcubacteria bacterium]|nr:DoxX family membrane protein [Candidatus Parcubacteria bacterium]